MATPQLSPGVLTREVDLTVGRADNVIDNIGVIAGPFPSGPVNYPVDITTEQNLIEVFGKPLSDSSQYEYWMTASSFLSYGGVLKVVRVGGDNLVNANAGVGKSWDDNLQIQNYDDYMTNHSESSEFYFSAKNPGKWANGLKVCFIDDKSDQIITGLGTVAVLSPVFTKSIGVSTNFIGIHTDTITGISTTGITVGDGVSDVANGAYYSGEELFPPLTKVTEVGTEYIKVSNYSSNSLAKTTVTNIGIGTFTNSSLLHKFNEGDEIFSIIKDEYSTLIGGNFNGTLRALVTDIDLELDKIEVKIVSIKDFNGNEINVNYADKNILQSFVENPDGFVGVTTNYGKGATTYVSLENATIDDWYENQQLGLENSTLFWSSIAPKPTTNQYVQDRNGRHDGINIVLVDDLGKVTGNQGTILEKHVGLSKAIDTVSSVNSPQKIWYEQYLADFSTNLYGGGDLSVQKDTEWKTNPTQLTFNDSSKWGMPAQDSHFTGVGNVTFTLGGGKDYGDTDNESMKVKLGSLIKGYSLFANKDNIQADYLIMGPGMDELRDSQAKASHLIAIADQRKDCVATISPHRIGFVGETNSTKQTNKLVEFFNTLPSSSYAIFDSGYKYTYDRFNNKFRYIPCSGDIAGLMCRTNVIAYPWFSPAGQQRGILNNAIKLAYNPNKAERDILYPKRINSVITQPGIGTLLFGDKTALGYASAFDRINVRRLFLTIEQALQRTAQAQLFELNDELTRANFKNIVEPYLRDIQAKRGLYGFLVVCDTTNNTPDVIDNNEFRADIYLKPAKSINYVTLTFVATRTGISFEEVAGRV